MRCSNAPAQAVIVFPLTEAEEFPGASQIMQPRNPAELTNRLLPLPRMKYGIPALLQESTAVSSSFSPVTVTSRSQAPPIFIVVSGASGLSDSHGIPLARHISSSRV
jgi:hypothetical protein